MRRGKVAAERSIADDLLGGPAQGIEIERDTGAVGIEVLDGFRRLHAHGRSCGSANIRVASSGTRHPRADSIPSCCRAPRSVRNRA